MSEEGTRVLLGRIVGVHGIRGDLLIRTFTAEPESIADYGPLSDGAGTRTFSLRIVRVTPKGLIARLPGVTDRTTAEALKGTDLYASRAALPPVEEGAYYHADLVGLAVESQPGTRVGTVTAVHNFGAGDILEIARDGAAKTELVPFTEAFVPVVDVRGGRIVIADPAEDEPD